MDIKKYCYIAIVLAAGGLLALALIVLEPWAARAAGPWYVAPGGDDGNACLSPGAACATINGALNKPGFVAGDTILVATGTYTGTGNEVVSLEKSATLSGGWDIAFTTQNAVSTIDGEDERRGITVNNGVTAIVERFIVQNGLESWNPGIYNNSGGTLTLNDSAISSNTGIGILNYGTLTLSNTTVSDNVDSHGYGIASYGGTLTLNNSVVSGNSGIGIDIGTGSSVVTLNSTTVVSNTGLGIRTSSLQTVTLNNSAVISSTGGGGISAFHGALILNNSTISGNTDNWIGAGIHNAGAIVTLNNSTVSGNTTPGYGGGIFNSDGTLTLNSSTVSDNAANCAGGGIYQDGGTVTLRNTILAGNAADSGPDCWGTIVSWGYNLLADTSGCTLSPGTGDLLNISADLDSLSGSPGYHPLLSSSPAIDAGNPSGCMGSTGLLTADQRGFYRFGRCDIGAYESQSLKMVNSPGVVPGGSLTYTIALQNGDSSTSTFYVTDTLPISLTYISDSLIASSGTYHYTNGVITWMGAVDSGEVVTIDFGATVDPLLPIRASITNTAIISGSGETVARDVAVSIANQIENVTIIGPTAGFAQIGYVFTATVDPVTTTLPITYVWQATAQSPMTNTGELSDTTVYTWSIPGTQVITVTAINIAGMAIDTVTVSIAEEPITEFKVVSDSPTRLGTATTFTATIATGSNVAYAWAFGDETYASGNKSVVTHTYSTAGTYTVVITASNSLGVAEVSTTAYVWHRVCGLTKYVSNPVLSVGPSGSWDDDDVWGATVTREGTIYKMWYTGDDGSSPSQAGLATSTDGIVWTKDAANPVLSPSAAWETGGVLAGSVISDSGVYKMWYTGYDSSGVARIGYATSSDGVAWVKYEGNPVLDVGISGSWEDDDITRPSIVQDDGLYHMWYTGDDGITLRIGHATSSDGINWTKDPANPVLDVGPPSAWDWLDVYAPSVTTYGDVYLLWYSGGTLPPAWQTGYALSSDGSNWLRMEMLVPEGTSGTFDAESAAYPSVIVDGAEFKMWYSGLNDSGTYSIGYASAKICGVEAPLGNSVYLPLAMKGMPTGHPCPPYYTDDFSDPGSGWPVSDTSDFRSGYTNGQYQIWLKKPSLGLLVTPGAKATYFAVEVRARRTSGSYGTYGIVFGINEDWSERYQVHIDANYYSIWRYNNGIWTALRNWGPSGYINTGTSWNDLRVIRDETRIWLYVNGHHLITVADDSFTGLRQVGLLAFSPSDSALDVRFDDFTLHPATCDPGAAAWIGGDEDGAAGFEMGMPEIHIAGAPPGGPRPPKRNWGKGVELR